MAFFYDRKASHSSRVADKLANSIKIGVRSIELKVSDEIHFGDFKEPTHEGLFAGFRLAIRGLFKESFIICIGFN